jgi:enoyl-CoA hydratase/carnithine racemase
MSLVSLRFNADQSRAAFTLRHPQGNIVTAAMIDALRTGLDSIAANPHLKLITI